MSYIGLDIGGTNVRYAFVEDLNLKNINYVKRPFVRKGAPDLEVEENICSIIDKEMSDIRGIGISIAAVMNRHTGKVQTWPNNPCWNQFELVKYLSNKYNIPIIIEDDANCGVIGEYYYKYNTVRNMAYITIGSGIGCGLILNGVLYIGENGFAGELGHVCIDREGDENVCCCGNKGCLQSVASGPAVLRKFNMVAKAKVKSLEQVHKRYMHNDLYAVKCISNMTDNISWAIYNLVMCLDISLFVIGGGAGNMGEFFITEIESKVKERLRPFKRSLSIKQAQLGEYSGVYGAVRLLQRFCREDNAK